MSWQLTGLVSRKKWGGQTRRLLALTMADKANDDGSGVYASVRTLARDSEISEATARRTLKEFLDSGVIVKTGERACLNGATNVYCLQPEIIEAMQDLKPAKRADTPVTVRPVACREGSSADTPSAKTPLAQRDQTPVTVTPKPILEPSTSTLTTFELKSPTDPKPRAKRSRKTAGAYSEEFEAFWKRWPAAIRQNSDKKLAAARWGEGRKRWSAETLMLAANHYLANTKVDDSHPGPWKPRTCQAQVFLNGKLEAAVEAALEDGAAASAQPINGADLHEVDRHRAARKYFDATGKWPPRYKPPAQAASLS